KGDTYNALGHAQGAVVASGTATVEAALLGTPMVIIYRGSELNWRLIRPLIRLDTFGMVNLIAGKRIAPELIQHEVTGEKIAEALGAILESPLKLEEMKTRLAEVKATLTGDGLNASDTAARRVMDLISRS
ncbi:MAG TPA: lipid-A-disaccharide synthase, partial [Blastocatellia bacterium]|nr:lipid-A-disaccharide synthase [Blastocatellia bacterium]